MRWSAGVLWRPIAATLVFTLLMSSWPLLQGGFSKLMRGGGELSLAFLWWGPIPDFVDHAAENCQGCGDDTVVRLAASTPRGQPFEVTLDSWFVGFVPVAIFLALLAGTRMDWRPRLRLLACGGAVVYAYVSLRVLLVVWHTLTVQVATGQGPANAPAFLESRWWLPFIVVAQDILHKEAMVYTLVPVLAWLFATPSALGWAYLRSIRPVES